MGELQAEANRLNALGERLTRIGQHGDGEFDFDKPVGIGGEGPVRNMAAGTLRRGMGELGIQLAESGKTHARKNVVEGKDVLDVIALSGRRIAQNNKKTTT